MILIRQRRPEQGAQSQHGAQCVIVTVDDGAGVIQW
jgi:hypothetical protein